MICHIEEMCFPDNFQLGAYYPFTIAIVNKNTFKYFLISD